MSKDPQIAGYPRQLAPHLELRRILGEGGSSIVFEAFHTRLKVPVAVKLLSVRGAIAEQAKVRLLREAELYALLDDPRIPRVYDVDELNDGTPYVVMEFVPGGSLEALLTHGPLSSRRAVTITQEVLTALAYVHARGVLHRDVKPANVILCESEDKCQVRLVDFGIAKIFDAPEEGGPLTQQGTLVGTPHYMAPERLLGEESDERSDVYSVGVMLYEMLSGRTPFAGPTLGEIIAAVLRDMPQPLLQLCPHISGPLANVVMRAMARDPAARFDSAQAMLKALSQIDSSLQGEISSPRIIPAVRSELPRTAPLSSYPPRGASLDYEEEDMYPAGLRRRSGSVLPLALVAGLGLMAWSAWPSTVNEREELDTPYAATNQQEAAPAPAGAAAPEQVPADDSLAAAHAPLAGAPENAPPMAFGNDVLEASDESGLGADAPALSPALREGAEPQPPVATASSASPNAGAPRASAAARAKRREREASEEAASDSAYQPARSVPLQPLLEGIDRMLSDSLPAPPATPPAVTPEAQQAPAAAPSSLRMKLPPLPRHSSGRAAQERLPDNPY